MSAWVKQIKSQVEKHGTDKASWYCFWNEPDGTRRKKSCGPGAKGKKLAEQLQKRRKAELLTGTYKRNDRKKWSEFKKEYRDRVLHGLAAATERESLVSLKHFEDILSLQDRYLSALTADRIADFIAKRRTKRGKKPGSTVSPATINKDLRMIKAALNIAHEWGYLEQVPRVRFVKEPKRLPIFITPEHFAQMYEKCTVAKKPGGFHFKASEWWRALLTMSWMTGWRIGELLALEWKDVDLEIGTAITRAADNKGSRDEKVALHAVVVEHIRPLHGFHENVFPWPHDRRTLDVEFAAIQDAAEIDLPCSIDREHECTPACHRYGFHDGRRAFASMNAGNLSPDVLQVLMRHKSYSTTQRYVNLARQLNPAVENLHVPSVLRESGKLR